MMALREGDGLGCDTTPLWSKVMGRLESGVPRILPVAGADPNDKTLLREREESPRASRWTHEK